MVMSPVKVTFLFIFKLLNIYQKNHQFQSINEKKNRVTFHKKLKFNPHKSKGKPPFSSAYLYRPSEIFARPPGHVLLIQAHKINYYYISFRWRGSLLTGNVLATKKIVLELSSSSFNGVLYEKKLEKNCQTCSEKSPNLLPKVEFNEILQLLFICILFCSSIIYMYTFSVF